MMDLALVLAIALVLDALLGEPDVVWSRVPHPAVVMGRLIGWTDKRFNTGTGRRTKGTLVMSGLGLGALAFGATLASLGGFFEILITAILLAHRSLIDHVRAVADGLRLGLVEGRRAVAMIVGRDTQMLDEPGIARAAIESAAENFSDGVVAPAFWFLIGGLPGLLLYKVTNTADSMIGYRTSRHLEFGWAAARFDDVLNWIPARLSAALIAISHGRFDIAGAVRRDARLHRSPNAGWPEAAMARVLNIALSGPRSYEGTMRDFPFVHPVGQRDIGPEQIDSAIDALWRSWGLGLALVAVMACL
jgi:adenosylcobinamide-phosphate synthase